MDSDGSRHAAILTGMVDMTGADIADIGIVGAGQLARMMLQAAIPLGISALLLAADPMDGAARIAPNVLVGAPDDPAALRALAERCRVVTFDHELVPVDVIAALEGEGYVFRPSSATMALAQDKRLQRERFAALGLPVPPFAIATSPADAEPFGAAHGWPIVVKAASGGYDGRGVWVCADTEAAGRVVGDLLARGIDPLLEACVPIEQEVAVLVARRPHGEAATWTTVETVQRNGILHELVVPADIPLDLEREARLVAERVAAASGVTGVLAVELFVAGGRLLINEIATRPHNSGHWTIEGSETSQFEQHLRAVLDLPLGVTDLRGEVVATANVLGGPAGQDPRDALPEVLAIPGAHPHLYGKGPKPGRKLGHVTVIGDDRDEALERARRGAALLGGGGD